MNKILKYQLPILFLVTLLLPVLNSQFKIWQFERKDENRNFKDSLQIDIRYFEKFPVEAELYVNDNFSFRTPLLDFYHDLKFSYFKVSPHPEKTIIGKDNWFFMAAKEKEIYEGKKDFSEAELNKLTAEWSYRKKYLDSLNIKSYWIIAPFKHYVYQKKLPFNIINYKFRRVNQLKKHFEKDLSGLIIDPLTLLLENKNKSKLYYQLDNHWNYYAGYLTTQMLLEKIKLDFPNQKAGEIPVHFWKEDTIRKGFHYKVLDIPYLSEVIHTPIFEKPLSKEAKKFGFKYHKKWAYPWNYEKRYTNDQSSSDLRVLFIRDSFGSQIIPFTREVFKETVFIFDNWQYGLNKKIIDKVKPDIVVFLGLETHIDHIIK